MPVVKGEDIMEARWTMSLNEDCTMLGSGGVIVMDETTCVCSGENIKVILC